MCVWTVWTLRGLMKDWDGEANGLLHLGFYVDLNDVKASAAPQAAAQTDALRSVAMLGVSGLLVLPGDCFTRLKSLKSPPRLCRA